MATKKKLPAAEGPARFEGFADAKMTFFHALDERQSREWYAEHKASFEEGWARPMAALLAEVRANVEKEFRPLVLRDPKVMRMQRDVRFSLDKSPYKNALGGSLTLKGKGNALETAAVLYLQLGVESFAGAGMYAMMGDALDRYRAAVLDNRTGAALTKITAQVESLGFTLGAMETLKTAPRGVDKEHPRIALLKRKGLVTMFPALPLAKLTSHAFVDWLTERTIESAPVVRWLAQHT